MIRFAVLLALLLTSGLSAQPRRIVSTTPSITEILFALGLGEHVVGVSTYCRYPAEAARLPKVGTFLSPDPERILALQPDLVVIEKNPLQLAERLSALKLKVLELDPNALPDIYRAIERLGEATGTRERARSLNMRIRGQLEEVRRRASRLPRRSTMFIVGRLPGTLEGLVAVGGGSYIGALMEVAGGSNVFHDSSSAYLKVSIEDVLARDPQTIIDMGDMAAGGQMSEAQRQAAIALWRRYPLIAAVRHGRVFAVAADIFVVPGPRAVDAARALARMLHPETGL